MTLRKSFMFFLVLTVLGGFPAYRLVVKSYATYDPETQIAKLN